MEKLFITPGLKLFEIIKAYPELEDVINSIIPAIQKITIQTIKENIYKTSTLDVVAKSANLEIGYIINLLREKVGQNIMINNNNEAPIWAIEENANHIIDAKPIIAAGEHPLTLFMETTDNMKDGEVILLITPFMPMPLIEKASAKGLINWTEKKSETDFFNYFKK